MLECTSCTSIGWGTAGESSFAGKDLRVLVGHESPRILQHLLGVEASSVLDGGSMSIVGRSGEMILLLLDTGRTTSGLLCLHWGFLLGKKMLTSWSKSSGGLPRCWRGWRT